MAKRVTKRGCKKHGRGAPHWNARKHRCVCGKKLKKSRRKR